MQASPRSGRTTSSSSGALGPWASASRPRAEAASRLGDALGRALGADVRVAPKGQGYKVTLAFGSLDEAMALAERLGAVEHA